MSPVAAFAREARSPLLDHPKATSGFSDSVFRLLDRIDVRRADTNEDREAISRLRYKAYLREGAISANPSGTFSDPYDDIGNVFLFGLYIDGELASSIRFHVGSREYPDFPSLHVFPEALQPQIDAGKIIIDTTRFVADENLSRIYRALPYATLRVGWAAGAYFAIDYHLAAVRAEHQAFYRRMFGHQLICEPRPYPHLAKPICLMWINYPAVADDVHHRYPFYRSTLFERRMLFERNAPRAEQQAALATIASYVGREPKRLVG